MPAKPWAELSADEKADVLRREFDAFDEHDRQNIQARAIRFDALEKRVIQVEEAVKRIEPRLKP